MTHLTTIILGFSIEHYYYTGVQAMKHVCARVRAVYTQSAETKPISPFAPHPCVHLKPMSANSQNVCVCASKTTCYIPTERSRKYPHNLRAVLVYTPRFRID